MNGKKVAAFIIFISAICFFLQSLSAPAAYAQNIDQATKETIRDIRGEAEQKLITPPKKPAKIKEEEKEEKFEGPTVFIKKIVLIGVQSFPLEDFKPILEKYENRDVTLTELKEVLTKEIEREYLRKGIIAACFVPPQEVKEGTVTIRVVEAKMGELEVKKHRYFWNDRIAYYWSSKPGEPLHYDRISRDLQFMNKNPDREVKAALHAGKKPETTDVNLDVKTHFPFHVTASFDREGGVSTGRYRKGIGFVENNFIGLDDTLLAGYTGGKFFGSVYVFHKVPITSYGTTILYGYSYSRAFPKKDFEDFCMSSIGEDISAFLYQDLYKKDEYKGEISIGVDAKNKTVISRDGTQNADRLRIIRTGISFVDRGFQNVTSFKPEFSQGLNFLGARRHSEFSSRNASNVFSKVTVDSQFRQSLVKNFQAVVKFNSLFGGEKLMSQEQFFMGGINSIRGYPSGDFLADMGFTSNFELLIPAFFIPEWIKVPYGERPIKDDITGVMFFDWGYGQKRGNMEGESFNRTMGAGGIGVRIRLLNQALFRLEWGIPCSPPANMPMSEFSRSRVHFSIDFQDKLPDEVARFQAVRKEEYIKEEAWNIVNDEINNPKSLFGMKVRLYKKEGDKAYKDGNLEDAKKYYSDLVKMGKAAYKRAEVYVRDSYKHIDELKKQNEMAWQYYEKGDFDKAKEIWQKVKNEANPRSLYIDLL